MTALSKVDKSDCMSCSLRSTLVNAEMIQIQRSRVGVVSQAGRSVLETNIKGFIIDAAEVCARASSLFEFSRRAKDQVPSATITWKQMEAARTL
jgi:hypothetical protein